MSQTNKSANEYKVAKLGDLPQGTMTEVEVGETTLLLSHVDGEVYAVSGHCSHYGAPLAKGALSGRQVICPWHHACFDVTTGDHLEPPGLNALTRFAVRVEGDDVYVTVPADAAPERAPETVRRGDDGRTFVVLGGGVAGQHALETLRAEGFAGRLVLVTRERVWPYDRTALSKATEVDRIHDERRFFLRDEAFYASNDIERRDGEVTEVDAAAKTLHFAAGEPLAYDALLVATGGKPRRLELPGVELNGIYTLRSLRDAERIVAAAESAARAVLVGSSFIALELAALLQDRGVAVAVVARERVPFAKLLGERIGARVKRHHEQLGTQFYLGYEPSAFEEDEQVGDGQVARVVLDDGRVLEADFVVLGVGVEPVTDIVSGVDKAEDGGIIVDASLRAADGLYAAGDVATFPLSRGEQGERVRIEHWRVAAQHGRVAARTMLGQAASYDGVPYFWTAQPDLKLHYLGHAESFDDILYTGDVDDGGFIAYYLKDGAVRAAACAKWDAEVAALEHLMLQDRLPSSDDLRRGVDLLELL